MSRLPLVHAICLAAVSLAVLASGATGDSLIVPANGPKTTLAPVVSIVEPVRLATTAAPVQVKVEVGAKHAPPTQPMTTGAPIAANKVDVKVVSTAPTVHTTSKPAVSVSVAVAEPPVTPAQRIGQYFEPVCNQVDKLADKQMFKIQSQLKQFVEKTSGKMSLCFMQQYSIDPNLTPVNKAHLQTICGSRGLEQNVKGSFKAFIECAGHNYDAQLDAELARINKSRVNCATKHEHSKNDTLVSLSHDEDELSLISEVVNKVMSDTQGAPFKTDLKVVQIDEAKPAAAATATVVAGSTGAPTITTVPPAKVTVAVTHAPSLAAKIKPTNSPLKELLADKKLMNDPNTMVLFVDDSVGNITTTAPPKVVITASVASAKPTAAAAATTAAPKPVVVVTETSSKPVVQITLTTAAPTHTTSAPTKPASSTVTITQPAGGLGEKIVVAAGVKTTSAPADSAKNSTSSTTTAKPKAPATTVASSVVVVTSTATNKTIASTEKPAAAASAAGTTKKPAAETTKKPEAGSTKKPEAGSTKKPEVSTTKKPVAAAATATSSTVKPLKALENVLEKQEQEKAALDSKLKKEREKVFKETEKKQDDLDAKKAIKALQKQRAEAHGGPADARMHQIEHERQMSIDPVGHTIKHQEYEMSKQKKAAAAARLASTTKKPQ